MEAVLLYTFIANRDVVDLIYRLIHQHGISAVIKQYYQQEFHGSRPSAGYVVDTPDVGSGYFMFNYRDKCIGYNRYVFNVRRVRVVSAGVLPDRY